MRPLRITKKRLIVSTLALEEFLTEFNDDIVDAIDTVWEYAYNTKEAEERAKGKPDDAAFDDDDELGNALMALEYAMEGLRDMFSPYSHVPQGGRHASQVLIGKRAGTITIVRRSSPEDLEYQAARDKAKDVLAAHEAEQPPPVEPKHSPYFPDEDDLESVFAELLEERHARSTERGERPWLARDGA